MRVGLFGGTFSPIHFGHLRSAEEVREAFSLDRVYFMPAARPPHKGGGDVAPAAHRLKMVELAVADNPFFSASAVEFERGGPSYSIDTIRHFLTTLQPAALSFIVGLDAFHELHTWKDYAAIPELCDLIVTSRPGLPTPPPEQLLPVALQTVFWYDPLAVCTGILQVTPSSCTKLQAFLSRPQQSATRFARVSLCVIWSRLQ